VSARWAATSREALSHDAPGWAQVGPLKEGEEREPFSLSAPFFWHTALTVDSASVIGMRCVHGSVIEYFQFTQASVLFTPHAFSPVRSFVRS
jgi:hypothetical protein